MIKASDGGPSQGARSRGPRTSDARFAPTRCLAVHLSAEGSLRQDDGRSGDEPTIDAISARLGLDRETVRRYARAGTAESLTREQRSRSSALTLVPMADVVGQEYTAEIAAHRAWLAAAVAVAAAAAAASA
ncbi:hypothetical protein [Streptomyces sp. NPDC050287]|uniref:hypothetical protein n=1 Tax=Streptomyces sp. NPDC050287 TaxID=3365608 RepID=UPI0037B19A3B